MALRELRDKYPHLKPHALCLLRGMESGGAVEVISYPWIEDDGLRARVNVRLTPGDPASMVCLGAGEVIPMLDNNN